MPDTPFDQIIGQGSKGTINDSSSFTMIEGMMKMMCWKLMKMMKRKFVELEAEVNHLQYACACTSFCFNALNNNLDCWIMDTGATYLCTLLYFVI